MACLQGGLISLKKAFRDSLAKGFESMIATGAN